MILTRDDVEALAVALWRRGEREAAVMLHNLMGVAEEYVGAGYPLHYDIGTMTSGFAEDAITEAVTATAMNGTDKQGVTT